MKSYYDNWETTKILEQKDVDIFGALERLDDYLREYPRDYIAFCRYIKLLISTKQLEKAKEVFEMIDENSAIYNGFKNNASKKVIRGAKNGLICQKLRYLICDKRFEEAYHFYKKYKNKIESIYGLSYMCGIYLAHKTNREYSGYGDSYMKNQILNYDEERFLEHAKEHFQRKEIDSVFAPDFPLEEAFLLAKDSIDEEKGVYSGFFTEKYVFKYDFCGIATSSIVDYFQIVKLFDSDQYITMYPFTEGSNFKFVDLNNAVEINDSKIKIKSQVEKFNEKYNNENTSE